MTSRETLGLLMLSTPICTVLIWGSILHIRDFGWRATIKVLCVFFLMVFWIVMGLYLAKGAP